MRNTPKLVLFLAGLVLLTTPILRADEPAAPPADRPDRHGRGDNLAQMAKELNLTPDQQAKIEVIHKQAAEARQAIQADTSLSPDQKRDKMRGLRKSTMDQVHALLTPEQQAKAKELREKYGRHGDQPPADKPANQ